MSYEKSFDTILAEILTDFRNLDPSADLSVGSYSFVDASCQASCLWGIYKFIGKVQNQISPFTCDSDFLTKHAAKFGVLRISEEKDEDLLTRLLARLQHPPAGGNQYDYVAWANEISISHEALWQANHEYSEGDVHRVSFLDIDWLYICVTAGMSGASSPTWPTSPGNEVLDNEAVWRVWENGDFIERAQYVDFYRHRTGMGSVSLVIRSNYEQIADSAFLNGVPSNLLLSEILDYIDEKGPVNAWNYTVTGPDKLYTTVAVTLTAGTTTAAQRNKIKGDIIAYMNGLAVGQTLYQPQLVAICVANGADDIVDITPATNVTCYPDDAHPNEYQIICPYNVAGDEIVTVEEEA